MPHACHNKCTPGVSASLPFLARPEIAITSFVYSPCGWSSKILNSNCSSEPLKGKEVGRCGSPGLVFHAVCVVFVPGNPAPPTFVVSYGRNCACPINDPGTSRYFFRMCGVLVRSFSVPAGLCHQWVDRPAPRVLFSIIRWAGGTSRSDLIISNDYC
jgi:hypothetical protein